MQRVGTPERGLRRLEISFLSGVFRSDSGSLGPPLTDPLVHRAQQLLGYPLPRSYIELLRIQNGGAVALPAVPTAERTASGPRIL
jgi:hypothetical protein